MFFSFLRPDNDDGVIFSKMVTDQCFASWTQMKNEHAKFFVGYVALKNNVIIRRKKYHRLILTDTDM